MGYNFIPSEISGAFLLEQLKKLKKVVSKRIKNFNTLDNFFKKNPNYFRTPIKNKGTRSGWLAYPVLLKKKCGLSRTKLQIFLEKNGVQTRPIFSGNILRQPIMKNRVYKKSKLSNVNSDDVMENGLLIGCHHGLKKKEIKHTLKTISRFIKESP